MQGIQQGLQGLSISTNFFAPTTQNTRQPLTERRSAAIPIRTFSLAQSTNASDAEMEGLITTLNQAGLYHRAYLGRQIRLPFEIQHPGSHVSSSDAEMRSLLGSLMYSSLSGSHEGLTRLRTFQVGPSQSVEKATRAVLDLILRGDRTLEATERKAARAAEALYPLGDAVGDASRTVSMVCRTVINVLEKLSNDEILKAQQQVTVEPMIWANYYKRCVKIFQSALVSRVKAPVVWGYTNVFFRFNDDNELNRLYLQHESIAYADLYASKILSFTDFLDTLERTILPNTSTPLLLYAATFWYISRGLSHRPSKLFPATWARVQDKWEEISSKFPESQVEGTQEWRYMTCVKHAILTFEADSAIEGESTCLVPFREEEDKGLHGVCVSIVQLIQSI